LFFQNFQKIPWYCMYTKEGRGLKRILKRFDFSLVLVSVDTNDIC
jgi:hypothetical protein